MTPARKPLLLLAAVLLGLSAYAQGPSDGPAPTTLDYDVIPRANFTRATFHFWLPASDQPIRAIVVLVPGYNAVREMRTQAWQEFAQTNRLALVSCVFQGDTYYQAPYGTGDALLEALSDFALKSSHPEVASAPLLLYGESAGGQFNYDFVVWKPDRVMAFTVNKGGDYLSNRDDTRPYSIPGLFFLGENDTPHRIKMVTAIWTQGRAQRALWALAPQPGSGHEFSRTPELARVFFAAVIESRLQGEPEMRSMSESQGWIGDLTTHEIHAAMLDNTPNLQASWLPDEATAKAWREFVVSGTPISTPQRTTETVGSK